MLRSLLIFALSATLASPGGVAVAQSLGESGRLFAFSRTEANQELLSPEATKQQPIDVRFQAIASPEAIDVEIPLFDGRVDHAFQRDSEGFVRLDADTFSWRGTIRGEGGWSGDVVLTVHKNAMAGLIYSP